MGALAPRPYKFAALAALLLLTACASSEAGYRPRYVRGYYATWFWLLFGIVGALFPHMLAGDFLDDPSIVRWIAVPLMIACGVLLADYHFHFSRGLI